jgi:hypothetical protein
LSGDGNGDNSFVATIVVDSLCSLLNAMQNEEKENNKQQRTNKDKEKNLQLGAFKK